MSPADQPSRPLVLARLRDSWRLLRAHPWASVGLGAALLLSLGGVCCGLGLVAAPWFICEMFALQLRTATGRRVTHRWSWIGAVLLQAVSVVVIGVAAALAITWLGPETHPDGHAPLRRSLDGAMVLLAAGGGVVGLLYLVPFFFAPLVLVERGGTLAGALTDSARLVSSGGLLSHLGLSLSSHLLQIAPALVAGAVALELADRSAVPLTVLTALPLMAVTVPLGQGMLVAAYATRRDELPAVDRVSPAASPPWWIALGLSAVIVAPAVALVLVAASLVVRPSEPSPGRGPEGPAVAEARALAERSPRTLRIPTTTLRVEASPKRVSVVAGDGGGAGRLPRPEGARFDRVRVVRDRDTYVLEMHDGSRTWLTRVDRAGVRLDDDLSARLADHLPLEGLLLLLSSMLAAPLLLLRAIVPFAEMRRVSALPEHLRPDDAFDESRWRSAVRAALVTIAVLVPLDVAALVYAIGALG